jgi:hypothetical protein
MHSQMVGMMSAIGASQGIRKLIHDEKNDVRLLDLDCGSIRKVSGGQLKLQRQENLSSKIRGVAQATSPYVKRGTGFL